jgi:hydrogenase nickel incorporation protein HypA/HybF
MHEVGIMSAAVEAALAEARARGAVRVHRVMLRIGALAGVAPEALRFAFEAVTEDTLAAGSELVLEVVPVRIYCEACAAEFTTEERFLFTCPHCQRLCGDVREGRELELTRIEIS